MTILFWNVRGVRAPGQQRKLRELVFEQRVDAICLQETMKDNFSDNELRNLVGDNFVWRYVAAHGHPGGLLVGTRDMWFDILNWEQGTHFLSISLKNKKDGVQWELINVYGPAHQEGWNALMELREKISRGVLPMLIGVTLICTGSGQINQMGCWMLEQ